MNDRANEANKRYRRTPKGVLTNIYGHMKARNDVLFSLGDFHNIYLTDKKYLRLHSEWIKSGLDINKKPSIDRINPNNCYSKDNIQIMTWAENRYKQRMELKRDRGRHVFQIKNGKVVNKFTSQREAVKKTGYSQSMLSLCLNGRCKTGYGYNWSYETPELLESS